RHDAAALAPALTHGLRAVALATDNPGMYESLARLAYTVPRVGLAAAREAARRDPTLVPALVDLYRPLGLTDAEWLALAPARGSDRLELAATLEARGLVRDALAVYRAARDAAPPVERTIYQWALGVALARAGQTQAAAAELEPAVAAEPANPELQRALGEALARAGDPAALDHLRLAPAARGWPSGSGPASSTTRRSTSGGPCAIRRRATSPRACHSPAPTKRSASLPTPTANTAPSWRSTPATQTPPAPSRNSNSPKLQRVRAPDGAGAGRGRVRPVSSGYRVGSG